MGSSNLCVVTVALSDGKDISHVLSGFSAKTFLDYMLKIAFLRDLSITINIVLPSPPL